MTVAKLFIVNFAGACLLAWAWMLGYLGKLAQADASHMGLLIAAVFVVGVASTLWQARKVDKASRLPDNPYGNRQRLLGKRIITTSSAHLGDLLTLLFILGILGNAIGFLMAFGMIKMDGSTEAMRAAGAQLLAGTGTAFGSTITGLSLAAWTIVNLRILTTAIEKLAPESV